METKREVEIRHGWAQKDILNRALYYPGLLAYTKYSERLVYTFFTTLFGT